MVQLLSEILEGPVERPLFGRCVVVRPTVETARANRHPSQAVVVTTAARRLIELSKAGEKLAAVLVEGAKDPTTHPEFHEISENLRELMNKWYPKGKLTLLAHAAELTKPEARHALSFYDVPIIELTAGTQKTLAKLSDQPIEHHKTLVEDLRKIESEKLVVRSSFYRGTVDNSKDTEVRTWLRNLDGIRPAKIQIGTPAKADGGLKPITKTRIEEIASTVQEKTGVPVEIETP